MFVDVYNVGSKWESLLYPPDSNLNLFGKLGIQHNDVIGSFFRRRKRHGENSHGNGDSSYFPILCFQTPKSEDVIGTQKPPPKRPFTSAVIWKTIGSIGFFI